MADDERRAEIEAATDALLADSGLPRYGGHRATVERRMRIAFEAADRVRDARGDDEGRVADAWNWGGVDTTPAAWSPQDEDHEAGIEAAVRGWEAAEDAGHTCIDVLLRRAIQAYLDRVRDARPDDEGSHHGDHD